METKEQKIDRLTIQDKYRFTIGMVSSFWQKNDFKQSIEVVKKVEQEIKELEKGNEK